MFQYFLQALKKASAYILLLVISFLTFRDIITIVNFQIHKEYIAAFLCLNRDKPEVTCSGKCFLIKELKQNQQEENQGNSSLPKLKDFNSIVFTFHKTALPNLVASISTQEKNFYFNTLYKYSISKDVFQPPKFSPSFIS